MLQGKRSAPHMLNTSNDTLNIYRPPNWTCLNELQGKGSHWSFAERLALWSDQYFSAVRSPRYSAGSSHWWYLYELAWVARSLARLIHIHLIWLWSCVKIGVQVKQPISPVLTQSELVSLLTSCSTARVPLRCNARDWQIIFLVSR